MDMNTLMDASCVPVIVTTVYVVIEFLKLIVKHKDFGKYIPLICVILGAVLGGLLFAFAPFMIPADNIVLAVILGGVSGWAATGADQTFKKLAKGDDMDGT